MNAPACHPDGDVDAPPRVFQRHPMVGLALATVAGTAIGLRAEAFPVGALCGAVATWLTALLLVRRAGSAARRSAMLLLTTLLLAWTAASPAVRGITLAPPSGAENGERGDVRGIVRDEPDEMPANGRPLATWRVPFRITAWRGADGVWVPVHRDCPVWWNAPSRARLPRYGDAWQLKGVAWPRAGGRDLAPVNRMPALRVYSRQATFLSAGHASGLRRWCYEARRRCAEQLSWGIADLQEETGVLQAIMLGYRQRLSDRVADLGAVTGTLHVFAISGSHVAIIAAICIVGLRAVGLTRESWALLLAPLLVGYTLATGAQSSAVRSCIMAILCFIAPALGRRADVPSALALAAILILACDPSQLVDVGFVLSFVVVAGLVGLYPLCSWGLARCRRPDPLEAAMTGRWHRAWRSGTAYMGSLLAVSVAAWVASVPLTAYYFERFTPITLAANLLAVPLAFFIVLSGCLSIVFGSGAALLAELYNHASFLLIRVFVLLTEALSHVPFANMTVVRPPLWAVGLYYAVLIVVAARLWSSMPARSSRLADGSGVDPDRAGAGL